MYSAKEGVIIWYLFQCKNREEQEEFLSCTKYLKKEILTDAFILTYDQMKRYQGTWHMEQKQLFPNCVFCDSGNIDNLQNELSSYGVFQKIITKGSRMSYICREEEDFLKFLCGNHYHLGMSKGIIRKGVTQVTEGPLKGIENHIRKIDRHKRLARVEMPPGSTGRCILAGLEIVEKS